MINISLAMFSQTRTFTRRFFASKPLSNTLHVYLSPGQKHNAIKGTVLLNDIEHLKISVMAPAKDNQANDALVKLLGQEYEVDQDNIAIVKG
jgi:uncharacterized protein YggU (UPF0235/DUF167 family)